MNIKTDCLHFKGDVPCLPNKQNNYICECPVYKKIEQNILIIKLGAIGDVIRTTPLLHKLREVYPNAYINWLSYTPELLSKDWVHRPLKATAENFELLKNIEFDWIINLDKDQIAISLTNQIKAKRKSGFTIDRFGHAKPIGSPAEEHKWITGLFDQMNKENTKSYMEEIFDIAGFEFKGEEYILEAKELLLPEWNIDKSKKVVGLNTGCGGRWSSRLWPEEYWIKLINSLLIENYEVILLGGEQENPKNIRLSKETGAKYFGYYDLNTFIGLVNHCDLVVTAVSMGMHISMGLKKKTIIFNNIFNKNEFYLYNRGEILEPDYDCPCYFTPVCPNDCMQYLYPEKVLKSINKQFKQFINSTLIT